MEILIACDIIQAICLCLIAIWLMAIHDKMEE